MCDFWDDRSRTSTTPIVHRLAACPASPLHPILTEPMPDIGGDDTGDVEGGASTGCASVGDNDEGPNTGCVGAGDDAVGGAGVGGE
jgi:hypothetical protein